jgi:hypothetical protein
VQRYRAELQRDRHQPGDLRPGLVLPHWVLAVDRREPALRRRHLRRLHHGYALRAFLRVCPPLTLAPLHAGCHQNNVSIELDYVTVPDGTTYSKCTSLKEPITCGKCEYRVFYRV